MQSWDKYCFLGILKCYPLTSMREWIQISVLLNKSTLPHYNSQNKASHKNVNRNGSVKSNKKGSRSSDGRPWCPNSATFKELNIDCWNMRCFMSSHFYLRQILHSFEMFAFSEHWLFKEQLDLITEFSETYQCHSIFSDNNPNSSLGDEGRVVLVSSGKMSMVIL